MFGIVFVIKIGRPSMPCHDISRHAAFMIISKTHSCIQVYVDSPSYVVMPSTRFTSVLRSASPPSTLLKADLTIAVIASVVKPISSAGDASAGSLDRFLTTWKEPSASEATNVSCRWLYAKPDKGAKHEEPTDIRWVLRASARAPVSSLSGLLGHMCSSPGVPNTRYGYVQKGCVNATVLVSFDS